MRTKSPTPWTSAIPGRLLIIGYRAVALVDFGGGDDPVVLPATLKVSSDTDQQLPPLVIAEDNADDLFFLRRLLAKAGVKNPIVTFNDGATAIEFLDRLARAPSAPAELPCIVFLDIRMPIVQGFEVLSFARKLPRFDGLRIVMLSSSDHPADKKRANDLGANGYFVKLPSAEVLSAVVRGTYAGPGVTKA